MAKKKTAKKKVAKKCEPKSVTLRFISDPGHGWLEVPAALCKTLRLGKDFPSREGFFYLEEDSDCTEFDRAAKRHGVKFVTPEHEVDSFDHWLSGEQWPYIPAAVYGADRVQVCSALEFLGKQMKQGYWDETNSAQARKDFKAGWEDCVRLTMKFETLNGVEGD